MTNFELTVLHEYVGRGSQLWRGMHYVGTAPSAHLVLRPLFEDFVRRAVNDSALLSSLVAATAFLMAEEYPDPKALMASGRECAQEALESLRQSLHVQRDPGSLETHNAVLHLCIAALAVGDTHAAHVHLKFLTQDGGRPRPQAKYGCGNLQQMHDRLLAQIHGCDFRLALETSSKPLGQALSLQHR